MKRTAFVLFTLLSIASSNSEAAEQAAVSYSDLNLSLPADQARLEHRVAQAASAACSASPAPGSLLPTAASVRCARQAIADTRAQVAAAVEAQAATKLAASTR